jgi:Amt family ammonium transporter
VLAVGLFASESGMAQAYTETSSYGLLLGGGAEQLGIQALGAGAIFAWTAASSGVLFLAIKYTIGLRVSEDEELHGLDLGEHGLEAYNFGGGSLPGTESMHGAAGQRTGVTMAQPSSPA